MVDPFASSKSRSPQKYIAPPPNQNKVKKPKEFKNIVEETPFAPEPKREYQNYLKDIR